MIPRPFSQADADSHYQRVEAVVMKRHQDLRMDPWVQRSWMRCVGDYALDPSKALTPRMLEPQELSRRIAAMGTCYSLAKAEIARLCESFDFAAGVSLTDADGVILLYAGTSSFAGTARYSGFREGAVWSEAELGTNGMGTCLLTRSPIVVEAG
ncbi:MAG: hypothetical protein JNL55_36570, partial [Steroidobacter sp.]|nr:hypothetical protein [Steroidobacter sp.]